MCPVSEAAINNQNSVSVSYSLSHFDLKTIKVNILKLNGTSSLHPGPIACLKFVLNMPNEVRASVRVYIILV